MNELTNDEEIKYDNKHEWYGLTPANREALVLDLIENGYTADDLNKYFNVNSPRVINDFMNRRGYSKRNNIYNVDAMYLYLYISIYNLYLYL